jgi:lon-related putative ATP-dependent protease
MSDKSLELTVDQLWAPCDTSVLSFETTKTLSAKARILGQERAIAAIDFGIGIASFGFNIYALGYTGTGRTTTIHTFLDRVASGLPVPQDWIYVHNFADPNQPNAVSLPPGTAAEFRRDMQEMVSDLLREIPRAFESEDYEKQRESIIRVMQEQRNTQFAQLEHKVNERGFTLLKTAMGLGIAPVLNGQALTPEAYEQLDETTRHDIEARQKLLQGEMAETMRSIHDLEKRTKARLQEFDREIADFAVGHLIEDLSSKYGHLPEIPEYLNSVQADVVENVAGFREQEDSETGLPGAVRANQREALLKRYTINVVVDHGQQQGAPVIFESNPTYGNLLGRIEHRAEFGALVTDFTMIKAGCLHRANGGYLVIEVPGLLANPLAWDALKRSLKNRSIRTEEMGAQLQVVSTVTLEPEPIPLEVKVVLIGDPLTYYILQDYDEDFGKLFKVQADFGASFDRIPEACQGYAQFIAVHCHKEQLLPFDKAAVGRVVEYGARLAGHQKKLTTRFGRIADLVREASYWARKRDQGFVSATDVQTAIEQQIYRANRVEERTQEQIDEGSIRVDVEGESIGQINGLSVLSLGNYAFGKPSRITVRTYTGRAGVISLDREAKLSGRIYDKGLLTLSGYLGGKYAQDTPLSLSASISFEQLYDDIEGDSASSTELYALLSSLSGVPLKQGLAVTGSVDQQGNIQPIGGVNEKIEGFYLTCRQRGLTGQQGVLIPAQNTVNLMLHAEVREAVAEGRFHIYQVRTIDEGLEILTGMSAGTRLEDGTYPADSIHGRVLARLEQIAQNLKGSDKEQEEEKDETGSNPSTEPGGTTSEE